jgi:hypothetical protein
MRLHLRNTRSTHKVFTVLIVTLLTLVATSRRASAKDDSDQPAPSKTDDTATPPTATPSGDTSGAAAPPSAAAAPASGKMLGFIEQMPPSAFPTTPIRGLPGGSLWLTFHGMQWPYYPKTGVGISGNAWVDTGYESVTRGQGFAGGITNDPSSSGFIQQGRIVLRVTPTWSDGHNFVQAQVELVGDENQSGTVPVAATADDVWLRFGRWNWWDLQAGRFQGWEIYHMGMGLDLFTQERQGATDEIASPPAIYGVTFMWDRPAAPEIGRVALHVYPTKWLRFEAENQLGQSAFNNEMGARGVAILDFGWLKVKGGAEYLETWDNRSGYAANLQQKGAGGSIQAVIAPYVELGVNGAYGSQRDETSGQITPTNTYSTYSFGAFANVAIIPDLLIGGGANYTYLQDQQFDAKLGRDQDFDQWQAFGAVQYRLFSQLFIKAVGAYALADFNQNENAPIFYNTMVSGRLRFQYLY